MKTTLLCMLGLGLIVPARAQKLYEMAPPGVVSRSISFENPTGAPGAGGQSASNLGVGRKGSPRIILEPGATVTLCDIEGPGVIRHIWMTMSTRAPERLQEVVIEAWWDGQEHPSICSPVGPLFGVMLGRVAAHQSAVHSLNEKAGMNLWLEMPFRKRAVIKLRHEGKRGGTPLFYNIDYTLGDKLPEDVGRLHAFYRRENPTGLKKDFTLMPEREGKGRYVGSICGLNAQGDKYWPGEGEFKFYMDGDTEFPTICGTGMEDWIGQSWGLQQTAYLYGGTPLKDDEARQYVFYRWHIKDPVWWNEKGRATLQQIGHKGEYFERQDDVQCLSFWYEPLPSAPLPPPPSLEERTAKPWKWGEKAGEIKGPVPGLDGEARGADQLPKVPGVIEGEALRIIEQTGNVGPQGNKDDSSGRHLWWRKGQKPGDKLLLGFDVPTAGKYQFFGRFLKAPDYGIAQFTVNGAGAGKPIDFYNDTLVHTEEIGLGTFQLKQGENRLGIAITGANPRAKKDYMIGLDYLRLTPLP